MEDPESKELLTSDDVVASAPLTLCSIVFRLKRPKLALRELIKFAAVILCIQMICSIAILFMRPSIDGIPYGRWVSVFALMPVTILYVFTYANIVTGPWGSEASRFWCDVRIMYVRGFNTIRTVLNMFSMSFFIMFLSMVLGNVGGLSLCLIVIVSVLSEWHMGMTENVNQYEVKAFDKFMDGNILCLESLHFYQMQHKREKMKWTSFTFAIFIKLYLCTCIVATSSPRTNPILIFETPIAVIIVVYTFILPTLLSFMFYKNILTFSQLELYRIIIDITLPMLIVSFSLV